MFSYQPHPTKQGVYSLTLPDLQLGILKSDHTHLVIKTGSETPKGFLIQFEADGESRIAYFDKAGRMIWNQLAP